ncbi:hypothetical protein HanRHA438_Chr07g0321161 [Helianthus annuus]|nr:hypothetical protein HanRHA438_Chr07g0321161 [Helianthus annuus]
MRITAASRKRVFGRSENALEWFKSLSPKAQYIAADDGSVNVNTYSVAYRYMYLNFCGFHIACIISLQKETCKSNHSEKKKKKKKN